MKAKFFEKYCRANWDGLYVDWHGPQCVANHERNNRPDAALGDVHFSRDGGCLPARDYFLFTRRLRQIVGPRGFLIGQRIFNLPNQKPIAATCTDDACRALVYRAGDQSYLVIVSNLGAKNAATAVNLAPAVLGMFGRYSIERVDAQSGTVTPHGIGSTRIETSALPPWGIEGFRLIPRHDAGR